MNSANILIPEISGYPIKVIASLFNSSLYQFLFQKKFSSIKVLKSHIEALPLPLWDKKTFSKIIMEILKKHLEKLIRTLFSQQRNDLKNRLNDLISVYPFKKIVLFFETVKPISINM